MTLDPKPWTLTLDPEPMTLDPSWTLNPGP